MSKSNKKLNKGGGANVVRFPLEQRIGLNNPPEGGWAQVFVLPANIGSAPPCDVEGRDEGGWPLRGE